MFPVPGIDSNETCCHVSPPDHSGRIGVCWHPAGHDGPHRDGGYLEWPAGTRRVIGWRHLSTTSALLHIRMARLSGAR